jgi:hypothetical protein
MPLPDEVEAAMRAVIRHLYRDAERDYEEKDRPADHIFNQIRVVDEFLGGPGDPTDIDEDEDDEASEKGRHP